MDKTLRQYIAAKGALPLAEVCVCGSCVLFTVTQCMQRSPGIQPSLLTRLHGYKPMLQTLRIGMEIAAGLYCLHPTIVHRDLKVRCV